MGIGWGGKIKMRSGIRYSLSRRISRIGRGAARPEVLEIGTRKGPLLQPALEFGSTDSVPSGMVHQLEMSGPPPRSCSEREKWDRGGDPMRVSVRDRLWCLNRSED